MRPRASEWILNAVTLVTGLCAVVVAFHVIRGGDTAAAPKPRRVSAAQQEQFLSTGHRIGPANARLTVVEFADFQCPACGAYELVLDSMRARHPSDFALVFEHFPLSYHQLAYPLARASECAAEQGRFQEFHDATYADQAELSTLSFAGIAEKAAIPDPAAFARCAASKQAVPEVESGLKLGRELAITGTPSLIVDGEIYTGGVPLKTLEEHLSRGSKQ